MSVLVIGIGNEYRRDDGAGLIVVRRLKKDLPDTIDIREQGGEGAALLGALQGARAAILVDAVRSQARPGTIVRFDAHARVIPAEFFHYSSHAFGVAEAIELGRVLGQLPPCLIVYGIEGKDFAAGQGISPELTTAVAQVSQSIRADLNRIGA